MHAREHRARAGIVVRFHPARKGVQQPGSMPKPLTAETESIDDSAIAGGRTELRVRWGAFHERTLHQRRGGGEPLTGKRGDLDADHSAVGAEADRKSTRL